MRIVVIATLLVFAVVTSSPHLALADDDAAKAKARKLLDAGDRKLKSGDKLLAKGKKVEAQEAYLGALADYEGAYEAFSDSKIYFAIGLAEKRLGRYIDSLNHFEQFLIDVGDSEALRAKVEEHTDEIKEFLGAIFFRVDPAGATITIDGTEVGKSPLSRPHYVPPGDHEYEITKSGFRSATGTVEVEAGEAREDKITLERDGASEPADDEEGDDDEEPKITKADPPAGPNRTPLLVGLALTGTFALAGSVTGFFALSRHDTFTNDGTSGPDREDARSTGKNLALATDVFLIGAIAAGTYTAYYYFAEYRGSSERAEPRAATVTPWMAPDGGGVAVTGRF